jgi:ribosomal protein L23
MIDLVKYPVITEKSYRLIEKTNIRLTLIQD